MIAEAVQVKDERLGLSAVVGSELAVVHALIAIVLEEGALALVD